MSESTAAPFQIDLEAAESWKRVAHVSVPQAHMEGLRDAAARALGKKVKLDGFRPGKVPVRTIRTKLPAEVEQDAFEALVPQVYRRILESDERLHPVSDPRVENLDLPEADGPIRFDLILEVRPDLEIGGFEKVEATRILPPVTEERVQEALESLVERHAHWHERSEGGAEEGDAVLIDYVPLDEAGRAVEAERESDHPIVLGSDGVLPEFNAALLGLQAGEETDVEVSYPVDYPNEALKGSIRRIRVWVKQIRVKHLHGLDDEFAREHSKFSTVEELRADVREQLQKGIRAESDRHLRDQIVDKLLGLNEVPVPPSLEARYLQAIVEDFARQQGGEDFELDPETRSRVESAYRPLARRSVQRMLLLDSLRRSEGVSVDDAEVDARIERLAAEQNTTPERLKGLIRRAGNLERLRGDLEEEKVFALLEERAKITVSEEMPEREAAAAAAGEPDRGDKE